MKPIEDFTENTVPLLCEKLGSMFTCEPSIGTLWLALRGQTTEAMYPESLDDIARMSELLGVVTQARWSPAPDELNWIGGWKFGDRAMIMSARATTEQDARLAALNAAAREVLK